jgi:hypothetical protein
MFIYLIVNHKTGKYYVGQHKGNNLRKYLKTKMSVARHNQKGGSHLFNAMRKYPQSSLWSIHALRSDIQTREELDETERDFIKFLRSQEPEYGYNICRGGEGRTGPQTKIEKAKRSQSLREMWLKPGHRENIIAKNTGKKRSPEVVAKLTHVLENARRFLPTEQSEESNRKRSAALSGRIIPDSVRKKISQRLLGRTLTKTVREKISQTLKESLKHLPVSSKAAAARVANLKKGRLKKRRLQAEQAKTPKPPCSVNGCKRTYKACGLCGAHLRRMYKYGSPLEEKPIRNVRTATIIPVRAAVPVSTEREPIQGSSLCPW